MQSFERWLVFLEHISRKFRSGPRGTNTECVQGFTNQSIRHLAKYQVNCIWNIRYTQEIPLSTALLLLLPYTPGPIDVCLSLQGALAG